MATRFSAVPEPRRGANAFGRRAAESNLAPGTRSTLSPASAASALFSFRRAAPNQFAEPNLSHLFAYIMDDSWQPVLENSVFRYCSAYSDLFM